jgi:N-acetylglucosamine-6-sulfatase
MPRKPRARARAALAAFMALVAAAAGALTAGRAEGAAVRSNVVFILTDDMTSSELAGMPNVMSEIAGQGTTFNRAYVSFPLCCPSRVTMLTGRFMHNHGVRGNFPPQGGWPKFQPQEANDLPVWLRGAGYHNVHIGKYMNGYPTQNGELPVPPGWDEWYGKVSEDALYFNYQLIEKTGSGAPPRITFYGDQSLDYQTDVFSDRAVDFVRDHPASQQPFLLDLWFNSPHGPFEPAPRDLFRLAGSPLPRLPAFNEKDIQDKPKWFQRQARKPLSPEQIKLIDNERRRAQEQLLSVDESVGELIQALRSEGILEKTYIIFSSDNGFFRGEHRLASGKYLPYDPSSRVPLLIRGPGIPAGGVSDELVWNGDIAQTILQIATGSENPALDGRSLLPFAENPALRTTRPILLEADTGPGTGADSAHTAAARAREARVGVLGKRGVKNLEQEPNAIKSATAEKAPAYRSIRTDRYEYTVYSNGQTELYDMWRDPAQLRSLAADPRYRYVRKWLHSSLIPLSSCVGPSCRVELGPNPLPLSKKALRPKLRKPGAR